MRRLKPREQIPVSSVPYTGEPAREGNVLSYTVSGRGKFPTDMLRYDDATLSPGVDPDATRVLREYQIVQARRVTPKRWSSFGWSVHDNITERPSLL